ncbi:MAG: LysM peptidoglycan-binding domain-containing protein [Oscillospiraceae bacterium]|nr:LysM peptidoglycan-binding domain-containing protein [Oscillospiraceae bacterium]
MEIYVVRQGDTLSSIGELYGFSAAFLSETNGISLEVPLVVGQTVVIPTPSVGAKYEASVYGYAYPFINIPLLRSTMPYMTYLVPFTYGITRSGELVPLNDEELLDIASEFGKGALMHLSTLTESGGFDSSLADIVINDMAARENLIENVISTILQKGYRALDIDFEFIPSRNAAGYASLVSEFRTRLAPYGVFVLVALAPKTSDNQPGLLYEGHNYSLLGSAADFVLLMTYEWGYTYGPPQAVAPLPNVRRVIEYALSRIPSEKIYLGIPNYGYDWTLPYISGESRATSISNVYAVELARRYGVDILYDEVSESPYFNYTDENGRVHEVHFEDARSIFAKLSLIPEYQLFGAGYWNLMRPFPQNLLVLDDVFDIRSYNVSPNP